MSEQMGQNYLMIINYKFYFQLTLDQTKFDQTNIPYIINGDVDQFIKQMSG